MPLRFTIRDLLWLTAVVALGVAWWADRKRVAKEFDVRADNLLHYANRQLDAFADRANQAEIQLKKTLDSQKSAP
jgi:hypothetical protein